MQNFPLDWIRRDEWGLLNRGEAKGPNRARSGASWKLCACSSVFTGLPAASELAGDRFVLSGPAPAGMEG